MRGLIISQDLHKNPSLFPFSKKDKQGWGEEGIFFFRKGKKKHALPAVGWAPFDRPAWACLDLFGWGKREMAGSHVPMGRPVRPPRSCAVTEVIDNRRKHSLWLESCSSYYSAGRFFFFLISDCPERKTNVSSSGKRHEYSQWWRPISSRLPSNLLLPRTLVKNSTTENGHIVHVSRGSCEPTLLDSDPTHALREREREVGALLSMFTSLTTTASCSTRRLLQFLRFQVVSTVLSFPFGNTVHQIVHGWLLPTRWARCT